MTRYELLTANKSLLDALVANNIDIHDVKYIAMVAEFREMKSKKHKVGYIVYHLAEKYKMSERGVYKMLERMTKRVKL